MLMLSRTGTAFAASRTLFSPRTITTLSNNPHIKAFSDSGNTHTLTFLETNPPTRTLAIGSTTKLPPTPQSFTENHRFLSILYDVLKKYAPADPMLQAQAQAFAGPGGATLGSGGAFFAQQRTNRGAGGASGQGGAGGGGVGGYVHLSDLRNPPDYGRIAFPEDILGSIEVDGSGTVVGEFQPSGTYRVLTNEGILGLSDFLRGKVIERLREEERNSS